MNGIEITFGAQPQGFIPPMAVLWAVVSAWAFLICRKGLELRISTSLLCAFPFFPLLSFYSIYTSFRHDAARIAKAESQYEFITFHPNDSKLPEISASRDSIERIMLNFEGKYDCSIEIVFRDGRKLSTNITRKYETCKQWRTQVLSVPSR